MIKKTIKKLVNNINLTSEESTKVMKEIMLGQATDAQIGAFLTALRIKGETPNEITAFTSVMKKFCQKIHPKVTGRLVDTCGTGGDKIKTFNISTNAAFVAAGAKISIAKHGNRSVTSKSGSADVLEKLGDIYLLRKNYENAFEIFKRLRQAYGSGNEISNDELRKKWMQVNLKMIRALVEMDSFQEARYLIREIRVKKFSTLESLGKSLELLGDIESNLARVDQAQQNYWESFEYYRKAKDIAGLYSVYLKLKSSLEKQPVQFEKLIQQILDIFPVQVEFLENRGWILCDRIRLLLNKKKYRKHID